MFEFKHTVKVMAGLGAFESCGDDVAALGRKALIVCDSFVSSIGLAVRLAELLSAAGVESVVFDKVVPNPTTNIVDAGGAISHGGVTVAHVISHVIGGYYHDIAHGDALNTIYPSILDINKEGLKEKHEWIARTLSNGKEKDISHAYQQFFNQFEFPNRLKKYAPDAEKIREIANEVFRYMLFYTTLGPVDVNNQLIEDALKASIG